HERVHVRRAEPGLRQRGLARFRLMGHHSEVGCLAHLRLGHPDDRGPPPRAHVWVPVMLWGCRRRAVGMSFMVACPCSAGQWPTWLRILIWNLTLGHNLFHTAGSLS